MRMKAVLFAVSLAACAGTQHPEQDKTRRELHETIDLSMESARHADGPAVMAMLDTDFVLEVGKTKIARADVQFAQLPIERKILRMDRVTAESAIVVSEGRMGRTVEIWVRRPDGWKLKRLTEVTAG